MRGDVRSVAGYIAPLEGMRGAAVLWVVAFHYVALRDALVPRDPWIEALRHAPVLDAFVRNGYLGVDLFFLISGFLLALPWLAGAREGEPAPSAGAFYVRRARRIVPAYYVQLFVLFAVVMPLLHGRAYWRSDLYVDAWNAVAHALFLQNTSPLTSAAMGANGALWTLAVEAQFYALLPLAAPLFVRAPFAMLGASLAASVLWQWQAASGMQPIVDAGMHLGAHWHWSAQTMRRLLAMQLPGFLGHFALGIVLGRAWLARRDCPPMRGTALAHGLAVLLAGVLLYASFTGAILPGAPWLARELSALALGVLLFAAASSRGAAVRSLLARGPLAFAGRVSYSAYLYHLPLLLLFNAYAPASGGWVSLPAFAAALASVSWLSWRYVERPFLRTRLPVPVQPAINDSDPFIARGSGSRR